MKRLSSGMIGFYQFGMPLSYLVSGVVAKIALSLPITLVATAIVGMSAYSIWFASRLSEVWLDGDVLQVKGPTSFRVPLADVLLLETGPGGRASRVFVLGLDPPVGKIEKNALRSGRRHRRKGPPGANPCGPSGEKVLNSGKFRVFQANFRTSRPSPG